MSFADLGLSDEVLRAVSDAGYTEPTPIQQQAIPVVLMGRDILGCAQTGTGKTAGFTLPMIDILAAGQAKARMPRSLILEPTRELAAQVAQSFETYGKYHKLTKALLIGGHTMGDQIKVIDRGVDVLIATPGRLLDLFQRGHLLMHDVRILVIDESDRMLDMGFIPDVEKIVGLLPKMRNTLFFSATMPPEIRRLADKFLINPKEISVSPPATAAETVVQSMVVVKHGDGRRPGGGQKEKRAMLRQLIRLEKPRNALIFCNRKRDVDVVCRSLKRHGVEHADRLHGDMAQPARTETLERFRTGDIKLLVCSDVAARGLDIPAMSHVFNFDVPTHAEDYIHRIGRTGRAGLQGRAITIATPEDGRYVADIERLTGVKIERIAPEGQAGPALEEAAERPGRGRRGGGRDRSRSDRPAQEKTEPQKTGPDKSGSAADGEDGRNRDRTRGRRRKPKPAAQAGGRGNDSSGGRGNDSPGRQGRDARPEGRGQVDDQSQAAKQSPAPDQSQAPDQKQDHGREHKRDHDRDRGRGQQGRAKGARDRGGERGGERDGDRGERGKAEKVKGLGSHMPAFLRTTPPKGPPNGDKGEG